MSVYRKVTKQDLNKLRKLSDQQKEERALKIRKKILRQTHNIKIVDALSPITEKLDEVNKSITESISESTKQLVENSEDEDGNTQTPHTENTNISRSLLDTLAFMKTSKKIF